MRWARRWSPKVCLLFAVALTLCGADIEYNAVTDRKPRPKPPVPKMGKAGSIIKDPLYGNRIVRVTDERTAEDSPSCVTAAAALQNTWNADSTRFVLMCGGAVAFRFDPVKLKAREDERLDMQETPAFSYTDPDIIYGIGTDVGKGDHNRILEYNFKKHKYRSLVDLQKLITFEGSAGMVSVSANDRIVVPFGGIQDTWHYVLFYDKASGRTALLDTRAGTLNGKPLKFPMGWGVHVVNIDKSGRYVILSKGQGGEAPNLVIWDTTTNGFGEVAPEGAGHYSAGYGLMVNNSGTFPHWAQWMMRALDPADLKFITRLVAPDPPKDFGGRYEHSSWNNARPDSWAPVFVSVTRYADAKNPLGPWDDEIIAISTDPKRPRVFRFAMHRSKPSGDFWDVPRGNVSPDGRFFMFTSNWEGTLGESRKGRSRRDVFVLELPPMTRR